MIWVVAAMAWLHAAFALPAVQNRVPPVLRRILFGIALVALLAFTALWIFGDAPFADHGLALFLWISGTVVESLAGAWARRNPRDVATT